MQAVVRTSDPSPCATALRLTALHAADLLRMAQLLTGAEAQAKRVVDSVIAAASLHGVAASESSETEIRRLLARLVLVACWTEPVGAMAARPSDLTTEFVRWIAVTSQYQRAALALYLYGCHSSSQAGNVLNLPPQAACRLIAGSLLEFANELRSG